MRFVETMKLTTHEYIYLQSITDQFISCGLVLHTNKHSRDQDAYLQIHCFQIDDKIKPILKKTIKDSYGGLKGTDITSLAWNFGMQQVGQLKPF